MKSGHIVHLAPIAACPSADDACGFDSRGDVRSNLSTFAKDLRRLAVDTVGRMSV